MCIGLGVSRDCRLCRIAKMWRVTKCRVANMCIRQGSTGICLLVLFSERRDSLICIANAGFVAKMECKCGGGVNQRKLCGGLHVSKEEYCG